MNGTIPISRRWKWPALYVPGGELRRLKICLVLLRSKGFLDESHLVPVFLTTTNSIHTKHDSNLIGTNIKF